MSGTVLILGATGRFGRHAAEAFWNAGWNVRIFDRTTGNLDGSAEGADVIVNGWNPRYTEWASEVPTLTDRVIQAARSSGATVLIPGNVYGYGHDAPSLITAETPQRATNQLGRIRRAMEAAYRDAGVQTIVLRAGDFIDTEASDNWFDMVVTGKLWKNQVTAPGDPDALHAWAWLPDMARTAVMLAERREMLGPFEEVLFPGYTLSIRQLAALATAATRRTMAIRPFNWLPIYFAAPFWPMGMKLIEMRYLWDMPHALDGTKLDELLPRYRDTDPLTAIATALREIDVDPYKAVTRGGFDIAAE